MNDTHRPHSNAPTFPRSPSDQIHSPPHSHSHHDHHHHHHHSRRPRLRHRRPPRKAPDSPGTSIFLAVSSTDRILSSLSHADVDTLALVRSTSQDLVCLGDGSSDDDDLGLMNVDGVLSVSGSDESWSGSESGSDTDTEKENWKDEENVGRKSPSRWSSGGESPDRVLRVTVTPRNTISITGTNSSSGTARSASRSIESSLPPTASVARGLTSLRPARKSQKEFRLRRKKQKKGKKRKRKRKEGEVGDRKELPGKTKKKKKKKDPFQQHYLTYRFLDPELETGFLKMSYGPTLVYHRLLSIGLAILFAFIPALLWIDPHSVELNYDTILIDTVLRVIEWFCCVILSVFTNGIIVILFFLNRGKGPEEKRVVWYELPWLRELFDAVWGLVVSLVAMIQGVLQGYLYPDSSEALLILVALLALRLRVFPHSLLLAAVAVVSHLVSLVVLVATGHHRTRGLVVDMGNGPEIVPASLEALVLPLIENILIFVSTALLQTQFEQSARMLFKQNVQLSEMCTLVQRENARQENLVSNVYPVELLPILRRDGHYGRHFENLGVIQNDIARFTQFSTHVESRVLFSILNDLYSAFDSIALRYRVEKVKTVGDSWVGIVFHPDEDEDPPRDAWVAVLTACEMNEAFTEIWESSSEKCGEGRSDIPDCALRTGVAIGEGWVYVIGAKNARSRLTFDVIGPCHSEASVLETCGIENEVMCSPAILKCVPKCSGLFFVETTRDYRGVAVDAYVVNRDRDAESVLDWEVLSVASSSSSASLNSLQSRLSTMTLDVSVHSQSMDPAEAKVGRRCGCCPEMNWRQVGLCRSNFGDTVRMGFDQFHLQTTFLIICFFNAIGMSGFVVAEVFLLVEVNPLFHGSIVGLATCILVLSILGIIFVRLKARGTTIALVWLVFVFANTLGLVMSVFSYFEMFELPIILRRLVHTGVINVLFAGNMFPSLPLFVKLVFPPFCFVLSFSVAFQAPTAGESFILALAQNLLACWAVIWFGLYWAHLFFLKGFEQMEAIRKVRDTILQSLEENERLLSSALPRVIVTQLQSGVFDQKGGKNYNGGCLFCILETPDKSDDLVSILDVVFTEFDQIIAGVVGMQRIKCFGSRMLCVTGMKQSASPEETHQSILCDASKKMLERVAELRASSDQFKGIRVRIGLHVGPFCGGICGSSKWLFDVVGLSINTACRLAENARIDEILCIREFIDGWCMNESIQLVSCGIKHFKGIEEDQETFSIVFEERV